MRLGCSGCLVVLILLGLLGGSVWGTYLALATPPDAEPVAATRADAASAQQKLYEALTRGGRGRRPAPRTVVLTERELNGLIAQQLSGSAGTALAAITVKLPGNGLGRITARVPLRVLLADSPLGGVVSRLPAWVTDRPVWLRLQVRPGVEQADGRRHLRLGVEQFHVGRLRLPAMMVRLLLDPRALVLLAWPLPEPIETISVEPGRVLLTVARSP